MNPAIWLAAAASLAGAAIAPDAASAQSSGASFSVRNDSGRTMLCAVRKAGTMVSEPVKLRDGETWQRDYPKPKPRYFRCEGAMPTWYHMRAGTRYRLARTREGVVVLTPA